MDALEGYEEYRALMDKMAMSNVDRYIDLPMIAVMGDTSSGKSSLLSSISMVELPSSDQLTTRCPIMLQMNRSDAMAATVEVKWKDKPIGKPDSEIYFEPKCVESSSWGKLTGYIADAQKHIVNTASKEVARDVVSVKVTGPHCEDLTLIDLPGIVRSTGVGESETLAEDIQGLIDDYLKNHRCVILAVHPANNDFHNSQIMADAKKVDPLTSRTLPVLTKPDIIDTGAEESVKDLLLGLKTDAFEKGFHMVKGRGQASLNKKETIEKSLKDEATFFRNTQPWRDVEDRTLFGGTEALRRKLGELQMSLVRENFPSIVTEMQQEKIKATEALAVMGTAPSSLAEKRLFFYDVKDRLTNNIRSVVAGSRLRDTHSSDTEHVCSAVFHEKCKTYIKALYKGKLADVSAVAIGVDVIATVGETEFKAQVIFVKSPNIFLEGYIKSANVCRSKKNCSRTNRAVGLVWNDAVYGPCIAKSDGDFDVLAPVHHSKVRPDPEWIRLQIQKNRPYKLPIFMNTEVFEHIVADCMDREWLEPCLGLVCATSTLLKNTVTAQIMGDKYISRFARLREFLLRRVEEVVDNLIQTVRSKVEDFIRREKVPYTQNHYLNENISRLRSKHLEDALREALIPLNGNSSLDESVPRATIDRIITGVFDRNQKKSVDDHMAEDMQHALDAYGKVALKRFIDVVPMTCGDVLLDFPEKMNRMLSMVSDEELTKLICVPRDDMNKRDNLKRKLSDLEEGLKVFDEVF